MLAGIAGAVFCAGLLAAVIGSRGAGSSPASSGRRATVAGRSVSAVGGGPPASTPTPWTAAAATEGTPPPPSATPPPTFAVPPPPAGWTIAGRSVQGRPILVGRFGTGPRKVLWLGGIHGDEIEGATATAELPAAFTAAGLARRVTLVVIWDGNPDGRAAHTRGNANGADLNRDFPASNFGYGNSGAPLRQPESEVISRIVSAEKPDLVIACHSYWDDQFVNDDGPAADLAATFSQLSGFPVRTSDTLGDLSGSMGSWLGVDMGVPMLTVEWRHGSDPVQGWARTKTAALAVIAGP